MNRANERTIAELAVAPSDPTGTAQTLIASMDLDDRIRVPHRPCATVRHDYGENGVVRCGRLEGEKLEFLVSSMHLPTSRRKDSTRAQERCSALEDCPSRNVSETWLRNERCFSLITSSMIFALQYGLMRRSVNKPYPEFSER